LNDWWREAVLIAVLPAIGAAHLVFIARRPADDLTAG
jgi:hypothetical protein